MECVEAFLEDLIVFPQNVYLGGHCPPRGALDLLFLFEP